MTSSPDAPAIPKRRWYAPTPAKLLWAVLLMQGVLFLSSRFHWFWFNERKGYTALIAVAATAIVLLLMLLYVLVGALFKAMWQFGLSLLLMFVVVVAIPLGWLGQEIHLARQQRTSVANIRKRGDFVSYSEDLPKTVSPGNRLFRVLLTSPAAAQPRLLRYLERMLGEDFFQDVQFVSMDRVYDETLENMRGLSQLRSLQLTEATVTDDALKNLRGLKQLRYLGIGFAPYEVPNGDAGLEHLKGLTQLEELHLDNIDATDAGVAHLRGLKRLKVLAIGGRGITDLGLAHLAELNALTILRVQGGGITNQGLAHLAELKELKSLSVYSDSITDGGLEHLHGLSRLETLDLQHTGVSDAGIERLKGFDHLATLILYQTKVTKEGGKRLKEALPKCDVIVDIY